MTLELLAENKLLREKVEKYEKAIEDIKTEIKELQEMNTKIDNEWYYHINQGLEITLMIIDKHMAESEE